MSLDSVSASMRQRYAELVKAKATHPFARWVSLGHGGVGAECQSLAGQVFRLDDPRLRQLTNGHGACGCRLSPQRTA